MQAVYASKLYKTSRRKDKIASAIADPINKELVQQIDSYLTDGPEYVQKEPEVVEVEVDKNPVVPAPPKRTVTQVKDDFKETDFETDEPPEKESKSEEPQESKPEDTDSSPEDTDTQGRPDVSVFHSPRTEGDNVEESTSVNAATALYQPSVKASCCDKARIDAAEIKGTLNVRDDTKGVSRIQVKDKELWIYYSDKINLNSVMEPVIDVLNSTGFTNLEFNRLARTENAIVFEINCIYQDVKPVKDEE